MSVFQGFVYYPLKRHCSHRTHSEKLKKAKFCDCTELSFYWKLSPYLQQEKEFTHTTTQMIKCLLCIWLVLHRSFEDDYRFELVVYRCPFSYVKSFATEVLTNFNFQWQKLNHHDLIISSSPSIIQAKNDTIRDRGIIFIFLASKPGWFAWNFQFVDKKLR